MTKQHIPIYATGPQRTYTGDHLAEIAFPLGGIGTGTISLGGRGELRDWEIFNRPDKGSYLPFAFFSLRTQQGDDAQLRVLEAPPLPPFNPRGGDSGFGASRETGAGLPHLRKASFTGEYPFARIVFDDPNCPLQVSLEAWNPTIPHNADDSGIPVAIFCWTFTNPGNVPVEMTLLGSLPEQAKPGKGKLSLQRIGNLTALNVAFNPNDTTAPNHGTMAISTTWEKITYGTQFIGGQWTTGHFTPFMEWVECLLATGRLQDILPSAVPTTEGKDIAAVNLYSGSLGLIAAIAPGETIILPIFISWSFPNYFKAGLEAKPDNPNWQNYYSRQFPDAVTAARYTAANFSRLEAETRQFHKALFNSSLPTAVLDAISSQMSIIKSTTCLRLPDGTFYGFEGCSGRSGCCEGSCSHVWNYAQTHAYLYPDLERSQREAEYRYSMHPDGKVSFRLSLPLGEPYNDFHACADGQMGAIMQIYRDWQLGAGDDWLRSVWPYVKRSLGYAWTEWDPNRDGLMEGIQHNTYDIEFHGPNPLCGMIYLGALRAAAKMADYLNEPDFAVECRGIETSGAKALDKQLFNGEYYIQPYDPASGLKYQIGSGCLTDQALGQQLAHIYGLGYLLPEEHIKITLLNIYQNNFKKDFWNFYNYERIYAINDEAGTILCTWPHGGRPQIPSLYCYEAWPGFEYQFASHLIYEGMIDEGLAVTKAVRDRFDGRRRNPWNEFECGNHYARSMSSWAIKLALDGFICRAAEGLLGFAPKINVDHYHTFWSTATGWGRYSQHLNKGTFTIAVLYGSQTIRELELAHLPEGEISVSGTHGTAFERIDKRIKFHKPVTLKAGEKLKITALMIV